MPGCLLLWRMPTAWCSTPRSARKPSAKVRCFLPEDKDTRSKCLVAHGSLQTWHRHQVLGLRGQKPTVSSPGSHT